MIDIVNTRDDDPAGGVDAVVVAVKILDHGQGLPLPAYATAFSAGADVLAAIKDEVVLSPGQRALIPTGLSFEIPPGFEVQIRPRSGLALKHGVTVLNAPGTIDADYRGEVGVVLINLGDQAFTITRGMRIAQCVVAPVAHIHWRETDALMSSQRGQGGFGSTGTHSSSTVISSSAPSTSMTISTTTT